MKGFIEITKADLAYNEEWEPTLVPATLGLAFIGEVCARRINMGTRKEARFVDATAITLINKHSDVIYCTESYEEVKNRMREAIYS